MPWQAPAQQEGGWCVVGRPGRPNGAANSWRIRRLAWSGHCTHGNGLLAILPPAPSLVVWCSPPACQQLPRCYCYTLSFPPARRRVARGMPYPPCRQHLRADAAPPAPRSHISLLATCSSQLPSERLMGVQEEVQLREQVCAFARALVRACMRACPHVWTHLRCPARAACHAGRQAAEEAGRQEAGRDASTPHGCRAGACHTGEWGVGGMWPALSTSCDAHTHTFAPDTLAAARPCQRLQPAFLVCLTPASRPLLTPCTTSLGLAVPCVVLRCAVCPAPYRYVVRCPAGRQDFGNFQDAEGKQREKAERLRFGRFFYR